MTHLFTSGNEKQKQDIEKLLLQGRAVRIYPQGYSMYPMFVSGRDEAVIRPLGGKRLKRGDVVLYRREGSILVLHRIWKVSSDGIYLVGDNQTEIEGPLPRQQMRGVLTSFVRNGTEISVRHPVYLFYSRLWLLLRPFRQKIASAVHFFRQNSIFCGIMWKRGNRSPDETTDQKSNRLV